MMRQAFVPATSTSDDNNNSSTSTRQHTKKRPRPVSLSGDVSTDEEDANHDFANEGQTASRIYEEIIRGKPASTSAMAMATATYGPAPNPRATPRGFFCRTCQEHVTSVSEDKHNTSTLHIFNQQHRLLARKVQLDESNKGFQLLEGMGWKLDEGLGVRNQGRVNPLQTTFKRDVTGLGAGMKLTPRVTHFPSHVPSQARNSADGKSDAIRAHESLDNNRHGNNNRRKKQRHGTNDVRNSEQWLSGGIGGSQYKDGVRIDNNTTGTPQEGVAGFGGGFWGGGNGQSVRGKSNKDFVGSGSRYGISGTNTKEAGSAGGVFLTRAERIAKERVEQQEDRKRRFELCSDIPEEFASLF